MLESEATIFRVTVIIRGKETIVSLISQSVIWALEGNGFGSWAKTPKDTFMGALELFDGTKAARE